MIEEEKGRLMLKNWANHKDQEQNVIAFEVRQLFADLRRAEETAKNHVDRVSRILTLEERCTRAEADNAAYAKEVQRLQALVQPKAPWEEGK